ncbi:hypothetical protein QJS10_CPB21g01104 [Acorus calamus]|uniref:Small auxin up regulated protein n=1 Tax=Acorus calamus TaxID=4465 RepID=A0AAV9C7T6_ACOCL|nr:hypothetical protein QJS10_CPB21g01104 [Acorus calamus]
MGKGKKEELLKDVNYDNGKGFEIPKGYVPMLVGRERRRERFVVRVEVFNHPCMAELLDMASQEFGYEQMGILKIPCDVEYFLHVVGSNWIIKE